MTRTLYLDCFSGISGDMAVGALCDLGVESGKLEAELRKLSLGETRFEFERQSRRGISGTKFGVCAAEDGQRHPHGRSYEQIRDLIGGSALSAFVRQRSLAIFERIAMAEAKIHGVPLETVGFHEVGAVDSIADIVGACVALELLGQPRVFVSPLREGRGWIDCAHGRFPLPAPATLEILRGVEVEQVNESWESITPTGAAIAREFAESFGSMPRMEIERIGYGIGTRDLEKRPNVLRAVLGRATKDFETDTVIEIETNLDDLSPELTGAALEKLLALGALDVTLTPVHMKVVRRTAKRGELLDCVGAGSVLQEADPERVRLVDHRARKGLVSDDRRDLLGSPHESGDAISECLLQVLFDRCLERGRLLRARVEDDVAAGDQRANVLVAELREQSA